MLTRATGDWVHLRNPNDPLKPTVAQLFGVWRDTSGRDGITVCWYYRPEQTVHRYDEYFTLDEVFKTNQYRDHYALDIIDRCYVLPATHFYRGLPRGLQGNKKVYVCNARYDEERFTFSKIVQWADVLPKEAQEQTSDMPLLPTPRRMDKFPSPIKHLLQPDARETDQLPRPTLGHPNAPPIVGAVHRRPREVNVSESPLARYREELRASLVMVSTQFTALFVSLIVVPPYHRALPACALAKQVLAKHSPGHTST